MSGAITPIGPIRANFRRWREEGPARGTAKAIRLGARQIRQRARAARLRRRPIVVSEAELAAALGGDPVAILRGRVLEAMPTVAAFEHSLSGLGEDERRALLGRAEEILAHRFDLLGSGPVELGVEIRWTRDFKSGSSWPLVHCSRIESVLGDGSDIKIPWELSRFQHLPLLAAAHRLTGDDRYLEEIGAQAHSWLATNPVEFGPNWSCTMDVAIRAANWVATLALCAEQAAERGWFTEMLASLLIHGRFIHSNLETGEIRGNHYLSDVAGLMPVAALFAGSAEGREWAEWGAEELAAEMEHQVYPDGVDHEGSLAYHRLVTELFICGSQVVDALLPGQLPESFHQRLRAMLEFTRDYSRPDGTVPQIGDADDGRFLPLGDYGAGDHRSHRHLFVQAGIEAPSGPRGSAAYPDGGYFALRSGELFTLVHCGDTGLRGLGGHGHNDLLAFELSSGTVPLVVDPGAYLYTSDPAARNTFRSTRAHSTLEIGAAEQNEWVDDYLFKMPDRSHAELLAWEPGERPRMSGRHHGYEILDPAVTHTRSFELDGVAGSLTISDELLVGGSGRHGLLWSFPLAAGATAELIDGGISASISDLRLTIEGAGIEWAVEDGWVSPSYGVREPAPIARGRAISASGAWRISLTVASAAV